MKPLFVTWLFCFVLALFAGKGLSSHYRGGTVSYRPNGNSPYSVDFSFRLSFRRGAVFCDSSSVANKRLATTSFSNSWRVTRYGWYGSYNSGSTAAKIYCSDFNVKEDWSEGYNNFTYSGGSGDAYWIVKITDGGDWIHNIIYSNPSDDMLLNAKVNRTGGVFNNSSPVSSIPLTVYVVKGIPSVVRIPVEDPDGDIVRCRNATYLECYRAMCTYFPYGVLDEGACTLRYNGNGAVGQLYPIILKLEDFPQGTTQFDSSNSLGSVDLQFIVHIKESVTAFQQPRLLVSGTTNILSVTANLTSSTPVLENLNRAVAVDVHVTRGLIFWSDVNDRLIRRANIDGNNVKIIVNRSIGVCDGLAVEWTTDLLYWSDTTSNKIEVAKLDGSNRKTLISDNLEEPRGIALDPLSRLMFWTDWGTQPKIERAYLNGENRTTIVNSSLGWPNDIALEHSLYRIYWVDAQTDKIETADYFGNHRQQLLYLQGIHPFAVDLLDSWLFWTDWSASPLGLHRINKTSGVKQDNLAISGRSFGLAVFDKSRQPSSVSACQTNNGGCSYLCLLKPGGFECACPLSKVLGSDRRTCISKASLTECSKYNVLNTSDRAQGSHRGNLLKCDQYDLTQGWYRFMGDAGSAMPTSCVTKNHCGTHAPGWMQGSHPTQAEGVVTRTVCYHWDYSCCIWSNNIRVRNCGRFYVYELVRTPHCWLRYCGNNTATNDTCDSSPCRNGGTCVNAYNGYNCTCPYGYTGRQCETNMNPCNSNPCRNRGTCQSGYGWYRCTCPYGYTGRQCETRFSNSCPSFPCLNGGTCYYNGYYGYRCTCPYGYTGRQCETNTNQCVGRPCRNGGTCISSYYGNGYYCSCLYGYTGRQCESNLRTRVTCGENYMQIELKSQYFSDIDWRNLHLRNTSCRATRTLYTMTLRTPLDGCGTTYTEQDKKLVLWNEVRNENLLSAVGNLSSITRGGNIILPFFCEYGREKLVSTSFSASKKRVFASEGSYGNFTFTMDLYQTSQYRTPYSPFAYPVVVYPNQPLWVQYQVKNTNADLVVFAKKCHATPSNDPNAFPQHVFLEKGCIRDPTMVYWYNPYSQVQRFSIRSFRFVYSNTFLVYLHCQLIVCHRNSTNSRCARGCISSRRRREAIDMDGSKEYDLSAGPLKGPYTKAGSDKQGGDESSLSTSATVGVVSAVAVVALLVATLLAVKMLRNRSRLHDQVATPAPPIAMDVTVNSYEQQVMENDDRMEIEI